MVMVRGGRKYYKDGKGKEKAVRRWEGVKVKK